MGPSTIDRLIRLDTGTTHSDDYEIKHYRAVYTAVSTNNRQVGERKMSFYFSTGSHKILLTLTLVF